MLDEGFENASHGPRIEQAFQLQPGLEPFRFGLTLIVDICKLVRFSQRHQDALLRGQAREIEPGFDAKRGNRLGVSDARQPEGLCRRARQRLDSLCSGEPRQVFQRERSDIGSLYEYRRAHMDVLQGKKNAFRDVAILNAAAAIVVSGKAKDLKEGVAIAAKSVDSAEAEGRLDRLIAVSNA